MKTLRSIGRIALLFVVSVYAAFGVTLTTVTDTIYSLNGGTPSGTITVSSPQMINGGSYIAASTIVVPVVNGAVSFSITPTATAQDPNTTYTATYSFTNGVSYKETWSVPSSATAVTLDNIRVRGNLAATLPFLSYSQISGLTVNDLVIGGTNGTLRRVADVAGVGCLTTTNSVIGWTVPCPGGGGLGYTAENVANKGTANGYAGLDGSSKVPTANLPLRSLTTDVSGILPIANGGTGTTTPSLIPGTNVTVTGTWPNQTVSASGGGTLTPPVVRTSATVLTVSPVNIAYGDTTLIFSSPTVTSANSNTDTTIVYFYVTTAGTLFAGSTSTNLVCSTGCTSVSGVSTWPLHTAKIATWSMTNGSFDANGFTNYLAAASISKTFNCTGSVTCDDSGSTVNINVTAGGGASTSYNVAVVGAAVTLNGTDLTIASITVPANTFLSGKSFEVDFAMLLTGTNAATRKLWIGSTAFTMLSGNSDGSLWHGKVIVTVTGSAAEYVDLFPIWFSGNNTFNWLSANASITESTTAPIVIKLTSSAAAPDTDSVPYLRVVQ